MSRSACRVAFAVGLLLGAALGPGAKGVAAELQDELATLGLWQRWTRINGVAQTPDGYLWIATNSGLVRYDGVRFVTFGRGRESPLPSNDVRALAVGRDGALLVGLDEGGGVWRGARSRMVQILGGASFASRPIRALAEGPDEVLWIGTTAGLLRWQAGRLAPHPGPSDAVTALAVDRDNRLFAGSGAGLWRADGPGQPLRLVEGTAPAVAVEPDDAGGVFVARDEEGVVRVDPAGRVSLLPRIAPGQGFAGGDTIGPVRALRRLADGTLMLGARRGLARLREGRWDTLATGQVDFLVLDHEGSFWFGRTGGGLGRVGARRLRVAAVDAQTTEPTAYSVLTLPDDRVVLAFQRRVVRLEGGQLREWTAAEGMTSSAVRALAAGKDGVVWIGAQDQGLFRLQGDVVAPSPAPLADKRVHAVHEDPAGVVWIGGRSGSLQAIDPSGAVRQVPMPVPACRPAAGGGAPDCPAPVTAIIDDPRGGLWVGTRGAGLVHVELSGVLRRFGREDGLPSERVVCLFVDRDGVLWIGTEGAGLVRLRDGRFAALGLEGGLPLPNVFGITEDRADDLWLGAEAGIFRLKKRDIEAYLSGHLRRLGVVSYDTADGMVQTRVSQAHPPVAQRARDGLIWFATSHGAVVVTPPDREPPLPPPRVLLEEVRFEGRDLLPALEAGLELPTGRGTLALRYTAPSFVAPHRIRFRHRLDGHDTEWTDAQDRREAFYSNLPPGTYSFHVRAAFDDLDWGRAETSLPFRVLSFYQRPPFWIGLGASVLIVALLAHRLRLRYVRARFGVVLDERNRIARDLHDSLAQYLSGIGFQLERLGQQLKAPGEDKARQILADTKEMVQRCRVEARQTIWNLRAQDLEGRPLGEALADLVAQLRLSGSAEVTLRIAGRPQTVPAAAQVELMRIVQEATANALTHGKAGVVAVSVDFGEGRLALRVEDDGVGFDPAAPPAAAGAGWHFGLVGMRERAERLGAGLRVDSQPGHGAAIEVTLPLPVRSSLNAPAPAPEEPANE
jgi:signal transduction histidine kinase/ligand-binding sensor domain-containing protein